MTHSEAFVFAEPESEEEPGYYGLAPEVPAGDESQA
jgi:hypothetical protein